MIFSSTETKVSPTHQHFEFAHHCTKSERKMWALPLPFRKSMQARKRPLLTNLLICVRLFDVAFTSYPFSQCTPILLLWLLLPVAVARNVCVAWKVQGCRWAQNWVAVARKVCKVCVVSRHTYLVIAHQFCCCSCCCLLLLEENFELRKRCALREKWVSDPENVQGCQIFLSLKYQKTILVLFSQKYFMEICCSSWQFGIYFAFWYFVPRKIWQPC
jgi:hypothetical protein